MNRSRRVALALALSALGALGLAGLRSHFQLVLVAGSSMQPTLEDGDLLLLDRQAYQHGVTPQRGDVVVVRRAHEYLVKRIVGLPGETVEVASGIVLVNGVREAPGHPLLAGSLDIGRGRLASQRFAVLGDNRSLPLSEIVHAVVSPEDIVGRVVRVVRMASQGPPPVLRENPALPGDPAPGRDQFRRPLPQPSAPPAHPASQRLWHAERAAAQGSFSAS